MRLSRVLSIDSDESAVEDAKTAIRAELTRVVLGDNDPETTVEDIELSTEEKDGVLWVYGDINKDEELDPDDSPDSETKQSSYSMGNAPAELEEEEN